MQCGKCRISRADLEGFHSQSGHAAVTESVSSEKLSSARHPCGPRAGARASRVRAGSSIRELDTSLRRMWVCRICVELASAAGMDRRRRESRLIRPITDTGHAPFARRRPRQVFLARARPGPGASFRVFQKTGKYRGGRSGLHGLTETRNGVSCRWRQVDFVRRRWHERAARLYLRHER